MSLCVFCQVCDYFRAVDAKDQSCCSKSSIELNLPSKSRRWISTDDLHREIHIHFNLIIEIIQLALALNLLDDLFNLIMAVAHIPAT